jgi:Ala-tRNA(Pro) deacylase
MSKESKKKNKKLEDFLTEQGIEFQLFEHPAVFTCEEAAEHCGKIPGLASKNLFLRNAKKDRFFLLVLPAEKRADLKVFGQIVGEKVSFGKPEELEAKLGLTPGAVSPLGLINDAQKAVDPYFDRVIYEAEEVSFHPNRNTASVVLSGAGLEQFLKALGREAEVVEMD